VLSITSIRKITNQVLTRGLLGDIEIEYTSRPIIDLDSWNIHEHDESGCIQKASHLVIVNCALIDYSLIVGKQGHSILAEP
jgi:hypothetical protein